MQIITSENCCKNLRQAEHTTLIRTDIAISLTLSADR